MIRIFLAFDLPEDLKDKIYSDFSEYIKSPYLKKNIKWVEKENLHFTIKFLGDVKEHKVLEIFQKIAEKAKEVASFEIKIKDFGAFPNYKRPKILWLGMKMFDTQLKVLKKKIDLNLAKIGFVQEKRKFAPHFTIGRIKQKADQGIVQEFLKAIETKEFEYPAFLVEKIVLYKSILHQHGPEYKKMKEFILEGN